MKLPTSLPAFTFSYRKCASSITLESVRIIDLWSPDGSFLCPLTRPIFLYTSGATRGLYPADAINNNPM